MIWGRSSVAVFGESTPAGTIGAAVSAVAFLGEFSDKRYAFLFKPGGYAKRPRLAYEHARYWCRRE